MTPRTTALALAIGAAFAGSAAAQSNADLLKEIQALKDRVAELEGKQKAADAKSPQWGMTPEQAQEFNRIAVKTEAMEDARDASGLKLLKIGGYMDPTFIYNKRQHRAGFQFLNRVDTTNGGDGYNYDNSYFGAAVIDFQKETDSGTKWRLTLAPNRGVGSVFDVNSPVHEASVSMPITDLQTRLIAGQIPDWSGYEYLQPTLNKLITHNLLFDFTLPTAYVGAGVEITRGKWLVKAMLANMNASKKAAGENTPVLTYRVDYSRGEFQGFGFAGVHGKASNLADGGKESRVDLFEFDAYFIRGDWTVQGQLSFGQQKAASIVPDPATGDLRKAQWTGLSTLAAYKWTPRFETTVRADYISNSKNGGGLLGYTGYFDPANKIYGDYRNGIGVAGGIECVADPTLADCNRGANRSAFTIGASWLYNLNTTFKAEYRIDHASVPVFVDARDATKFAKTNHLLGASMLVSF